MDARLTVRHDRGHLISPRFQSPVCWKDSFDERRVHSHVHKTIKDSVARSIIAAKFRQVVASLPSLSRLLIKRRLLPKKGPIPEDPVRII